MKKFSHLAIPYIVWAVMMLLLPMGLIAVYSFMDSGNSIITFSFYAGALCQFF